MENGKLKADFFPLFRKGRGRSVLVSTFFICTLWLLAGCRHTPDYTLFEVPDTLVLQTGDIVFRTGESIESKTVTSFDKESTYSHIGMVLWHNNQWCVLHAVPNERATKNEKDSVKIEPIGVFFRSDRALEGCVCRMPLSPEDTLKLWLKAENLYSRHPLFDKAFDDKDSSTFYCSELVWFLYRQSLDVDLTQGRRHKLPLFPPLIFCSDIKAYPELKEVYKF